MRQGPTPEMPQNGRLIGEKYQGLERRQGGEGSFESEPLNRALLCATKVICKIL